MTNSSYSRSVSGPGAWLHSPSWERPTPLAASQVIWSDPFTSSVPMDEAQPILTNPFIYCPQTRALLTSLCSNTGTGHSIPAFPPARGSLHPLIPWNHLPGQHLHLLLFCWCLCEQEQRSLQRLSTIPLTDHSIWDNYISSSFARKKGKQWEAN